MTSLAELGVDPTRLVLALARTLRSAADQLDPGGAPADDRKRRFTTRRGRSPPNVANDSELDDAVALPST